MRYRSYLQRVPEAPVFLHHHCCQGRPERRTKCLHSIPTKILPSHFLTIRYYHELVTYGILPLRLLLSFCFDWEYISNTRDRISSAIQAPQISLKIRCASVVFSTLFSVFGYPDETLTVVFWYYSSQNNLVKVRPKIFHFDDNAVPNEWTGNNSGIIEALNGR